VPNIHVAQQIFIDIYNNDNRQLVPLSYKHATNISTSIKVAVSAKGYIYKAAKPIAKDTTLKPKMSV